MEPPQLPSTRLKDLHHEALPREALQQHGAGSLPTADLIAILLGSGVKGCNVRQVASELLNHFGDVRRLGRASYDEILNIHGGQRGIGPVRATVLAAAIELARRMYEPETKVVRKSLITPERVYELMRPDAEFLAQECFWILHLNNKRILIGQPVKIATGCINRAFTDAREVFRRAVSISAHSLILVHNHPSGDVTPSQADLMATRSLISAGRILGIEVVDHIIIGNADSTNERYLSLRARGLCNFEPTE